MGREHVATYDAFTWAPAIPAVVANADHGIAAQPEVPAEDKCQLETVFAKFDAHFGVHSYRSIKSQDFLSRTRGPKPSVQSFISDLKRKAQHCDYGDREEELIIDMLINRVCDQKITEKLMELPDDQLTLSNTIRIPRCKTLMGVLGLAGCVALGVWISFCGVLGSSACFLALVAVISFFVGFGVCVVSGSGAVLSGALVTCVTCGLSILAFLCCDSCYSSRTPNNVMQQN